MRIRIPRYYGNLDFWVLVFSLFFIRLPVAFGFRQNPEVRLLFLLPLVAISSKNIIFTLLRSKIRFNKFTLILFLGFGLFLVAAYTRTTISGVFPASTVIGNLFIWVVVAVFSFTLYTTARNEQVKQLFRRGTLLAFSAYVVCNFALFLIGYKSPEVLYLNPIRAALLGNFGINISRVLFPTASGINTFGATAGAFLVASVAILTSRTYRIIDRVSATLCFISSLAVILLTDSRGALAFSVIVSLVILFLPRKLYPWLGWLPVLAPLLPLTLLLVINFLPPSIASTLSRGQGDLSNMSNRLEIWNVILKELSNFRPEHLIGFGYRGQVLSGLSRSYSHLFATYTTSDVASAHNFLLQSILEIGYLGTALLIGLLIAIMRKLARAAIHMRDDYTPKAMLFTLCYLILLGTTEAVFSSDLQEIFIVFLLIWAASGTLTSGRKSILHNEVKPNFSTQLLAEKYNARTF